MDMMITPENMWFFLVPLLFGPFVQEDVAVMGAAGLSVANPAFTPIIALFIFAGLFVSDIWKYWIGWLARTRKWASEYNSKIHFRGVRRTLRAHPGKTFMAVRFLPLIRIPAYVAAGYSRLPYVKFCFWMAASGALYIALIFGLFHVLGRAFAEQARVVLPLVAIGLLAIAVTIAMAQKRKITALAEAQNSTDSDARPGDDIRATDPANSA